MALYALDDDDLIHAADANPHQTYWCTHCFGPVKRRKGRLKFPHFYHLKTTPSCRLYSKSEDHLVAQIELQNLFPEKEIELEKPFIQIGRVADACWEKEKIIFEIQCSFIHEEEIKKRMRDYESIGYHVTWLLDDKRFNKRLCRSSEQLLREKSCYYLSIHKGQIYDQFEHFSETKRIRKSKPLPVDLTRVFLRGAREFNEADFPRQITRLKAPRYFYGDRLSLAIRFPLLMKLEKELEIQLAKKPSSILAALKKIIVAPYLRWLEKAIKGR